MEKFSLRNQQAIILRLIKEPFLIEKFYDNLRPEDFSSGQQDLKKQAVGRMIEVILSYHKEKSIDRLNVDSFKARLNSYADSEVNAETRKMFLEMTEDSDLHVIAQNDGILEVFLEILQRNMIQRWFPQFKNAFISNDTRSAIVKGKEFFEKIEQVRIQDEAEFDYREVSSLFDADDFSPDLCLATGLPDFDTELCGGLEPSTLTVFVAPPAGGKPIWEETLITMSDGSRKKLKDVQIGDLVIGGKTGLPRKVTNVFVQGELDCLKIISDSGREIFTAPDHGFLTADGWTEANKLRPGMSLALMSYHETRSPNESRKDVEFRMAGYFIGDGCCTGDSRALSANVVCFDNVQTAYIYKCVDLLGWKAKEGRRGRIEMSCGVRDWLRDVGLAGHNSHTKRVPEFVFHGSKRQVAEFIAAYFECDGTVGVKEKTRLDVCLEFYSVSQDLLQDLQHLLQILGINSLLRPKKGKYQEKQHDSWRLSLASRNDVARFRAFVPVVGKKNTILQNALAYRNRFDTKYFTDEIVSILSFHFKLPCRCITVEEDSSFVAAGFVVHNSQCCSHLVQQCVIQRKYAHVTLVEDRKKTFLPRVLSGLSRIPIRRLKKEFGLLTPEEKARFDKAVVAMRTFIKLEFLYDSSVSEIHRRKAEWLKYCQAHSLPLPAVDIVDYSGHVAMTAVGDKSYEKYLSAYTARKNYALKNEIIGIDFAQVNRAGSQKMSGEDIITKNDLASSFDIARVCDNIITINRNDDQKIKNKAVWYIAKIRDGGEIDGNKFECDTNFDYGHYDLLNAVNLSRLSHSIKGSGGK